MDLYRLFVFFFLLAATNAQIPPIRMSRAATAINSGKLLLEDLVVAAEVFGEDVDVAALDEIGVGTKVGI